MLGMLLGAARDALVCWLSQLVPAPVTTPSASPSGSVGQPSWVHGQGYYRHPHTLPLGCVLLLTESLHERCLYAGSVMRTHTLTASTCCVFAAAVRLLWSKYKACNMPGTACFCGFCMPVCRVVWVRVMRTSYSLVLLILCGLLQALLLLQQAFVVSLSRVW